MQVLDNADPQRLKEELQLIKDESAARPSKDIVQENSPFIFRGLVSDENPDHPNPGHF